MPQENVEIVRRGIDAFVREGTNASYEGLVAEDLEVRRVSKVGGGKSFAGPEEFAPFVGQCREDFEALATVHARPT